MNPKISEEMWRRGINKIMSIQIDKYEPILKRNYYIVLLTILKIGDSIILNENDRILISSFKNSIKVK